MWLLSEMSITVLREVDILTSAGWSSLLSTFYRNKKDFKIHILLYVSNDHSKWRYGLIVSILENKKSAILFISFIPTVHNLVTSVVDGNTLSIPTCELIHSTTRQFHSYIVGLTLVALLNRFLLAKGTLEFWSIWSIWSSICHENINVIFHL